MKPILFCVFLIAITFTSSSQSLKKLPISNSGCSAYFYCEKIKFDEDFSEDSSKVYTGECINGDVTYGVICVKLLNPIPSMDDAEEVMISYLDYLKLNFEIKKSAGYGKGHHLNDNEATRGILDYWQDANGAEWKIKSWTDGTFIGFLYASSKKPLPETKVDVFLNSFRFPGM